MKRNLRQLLISLLVVVICLLEYGTTAYAKGEHEHNADLESIMFQNHSFSYDQEEIIENIESAAELAIDQYNGSGTENLNRLLRKYGSISSPIPKDINEINFTAGSEHRKYTHRGWDFVYDYKPNNYTKDWQKTWEQKKDILMYVVNSSFDFSDDETTGGKYSSKCNSFCAMVYYIHLLGDHENDFLEDSARKDVFEDKMGVGGLCDKTSLGDKYTKYPLNTDMIDEIITHSAVLFKDQRFSPRYLFYLAQLKSLDSDFKKIVNYDGRIIDYDKYYKYTERLRKILTSNLYPLLMEEEFFSTKFADE